uniref:Plus3 domain-containing protein n=1 Tax=Elaeophora elaphi TaxID=1147741 RepID=A0A0R3RYE0_9BILA
MVKKSQAKNIIATDASLKYIKSKSMKLRVKSVIDTVISIYYNKHSCHFNAIPKNFAAFTSTSITSALLSIKGKRKFMRPTAAAKEILKKFSRNDIIKSHISKARCQNVKNVKSKLMESSKSLQSKSTSTTYSSSNYDDDETDLGDMKYAFAINLPEYLIRYTDECDTVYEKIEDEMRPIHFPTSFHNRKDDAIFERINGVVHPVRIGMKIRKLKMIEQSSLSSLIEVIGTKNIIMNDTRGCKIRVIATMKKGGDDNPLANVKEAKKRPIDKRDKVSRKSRKKSMRSVMETWEDQYGNKIPLTDDLKKLKVTTEEALRKDEDREVIEKRIKRTTKLIAISRREAIHKRELKKGTMKSDIKEMDYNKLRKILKAFNKDELDVQYTQYSDDLSPGRNIFEMKKKKTTTTSLSSIKQPVQKSKIPVKEIKLTSVELESTQTAILAIPSKDQQPQVPGSERVSQRKMVEKEESKKVDKRQDKTSQEIKNDEQNKISQDMNENEHEQVESEYLSTPLDFYLRGRMMSRPSRNNETS